MVETRKGETDHYAHRGQNDPFEGGSGCLERLKNGRFESIRHQKKLWTMSCLNIKDCVSRKI